MKKSILFILFGLAVISGFSQTTDEQLARQYLDAEEYDKAKLYYEKLYEANDSRDNFRNLLLCYEKLNELNDAEKHIKKHIRRNPGELEFEVALGVFYKNHDETSKAKKLFEGLIKDLDPNYEDIITLANAFQANRELDYALETYLKGRKLMKNTYPFYFEVASIYNQKHEYEKMISEYLNVLDEGESYMQSVQNALQTNLDPDPDNIKKNLLKQELLRRIQKNANNAAYSEMLIWVFIQEKNFNGAYIQAKALDKRNKEDGHRLFALAQLALNNLDFDVAEKCYNYVIEKGPQTYYYYNARMQLVKALQTKIEQTGAYTEQDLKTLDEAYASTVEDLGKSYRTINFIKDWAHLKAFYLNDKDKAISLLQEAVKMANIKPEDRARCKLELADVYVMYGAVWDASLLYSQVEKDFKHDRLGEMAKFKNAKISFYTGDFNWAKAQLDVLKASTSKLIANDAMRLSLLITDNTIVDTNKTPLMMFARADLLLYRNETARAVELLDSIKSEFPGHSLADEILFKRYEIEKRQQNFKKAAEYLNELVQGYPYDILADDALYELARMNEYQFNDKEKALELYKQLLLNFPGSLYADDARKHLRNLRKEQQSPPEIKDFK